MKKTILALLLFSALAVMSSGSFALSPTYEQRPSHVVEIPLAASKLSTASAHTLSVEEIQRKSIAMMVQ